MKSRYKITQEIKTAVRKQLQEERRVVVKERLTAVHMYIKSRFCSESNRVIPILNQTTT